MANTKPTAVGSKIYWEQTVPVARATLRRGAIAALSRGLMHPGLQVAILAAGWVWSQQEGIHKPAESVDVSEYIDPNGQYQCYSTGWNYNQDAPFPTSSLAYNSDSCTSSQLPPWSTAVGVQSDGGTVEIKLRSSGDDYKFFKIRPATSGTQGSAIPQMSVEQPAEPYEGDFSDIDPHIPPQLLTELWSSEDTIPEWQDEISVMGKPATEVDAKGNPAPEIAKAVGKRAANIAAQVNGEDTPYPESGSSGDTAEDEMLEEWQKPIPPFAEVTPEWQVETIDSLPDYDIGLGSGSCPGPTVIALPAPFGGSLSLDWQPLCDFASMIRGAVIAVCMILSLYIVLRST